MKLFKYERAKDFLKIVCAIVLLRASREARCEFSWGIVNTHVTEKRKK